MDLPNRVTSSGGRFHYKDDWEFYDVQNITFEFPEGKAINWEGRSANGYGFWGRGRGVVIHGTDGTIDSRGGNGYVVYDMDNNEIERHMADDQQPDPLDTVGAGGLTDRHIHNFAMGVQGREPLNSPIDIGQKSVLALHLGNISQYVGRSLNINPDNGRIIGDPEAMTKWSRTYEPGWEPRI